MNMIKLEIKEQEQSKIKDKIIIRRIKLEKAAVD